MIERIYIDNFRCFVNFEWKPGPFSLLMGRNGSGKSSVFDVMEALGRVVSAGSPVLAEFPAETITAWETRSRQSFAIDLSLGDRRYAYGLDIEHDASRRKNRIVREHLSAGGGLNLYEFVDGRANLYRDNGSAGPSFEFESTRSAIATIPERHDNTLLTAFRDAMANFFVASPEPVSMSGASEREQDFPDRRLHDIVSWLRHRSLEDIDLMPRLRCDLRQVLDGFSDFALDKWGENGRTLRFDFDAAGGGGRYSMGMSRLSDGQRMLFALYALLHGAVRPNGMLCIDEPDNYAALREIQPWLAALNDKVHESGAQCFVVSHSPEVIDYMSAIEAWWFFREHGGAVRVKPFEVDEAFASRPSELVARGWE